MTDPHSDRDDAVRRRLAAARHAEPMPDEVAARLDRVLADLSAERAGAQDEPGTAGTVVPFRRRRVAQALLAAAAAAAIGFGVSQLLPENGSLTAADRGNDSAAESGEPDRGAADQGGAPAEGDASTREEASPLSPGATLGDLPTLPALDEASLLRLGELARLTGTEATPSCIPGPVPDAALAARATHRGEVVEVLFTPISPGAERAEVFSCAPGRPQEPIATLVIRSGE